jgi:glycosyltransferase involved in cell wall biosynthesis
MTVYNAASYLRASTESILGQTWEDFEFIIVDDGSTDQSRAILDEFTDSRIKRLDLTHIGIVPALNQAIAAARGRYIARMDADDISLPPRLAQQVTALEADPRAVVAGCSFVEIDAHGGQRSIATPATVDGDLRRRLMVRNPYAGGSVLIRRDPLLAIGGYPREVELAEDYAILPRLSAVGRLTSAPEVLYQWRFHQPSTSQRLRAQMSATYHMVKDALWRSGPPAHRSHRALTACAAYYRGLEVSTNRVLAAQFLETECLLALETLKRSHIAAGLRQLVALLLADPRAWLAVADDLPKRLQRRVEHNALARRHRGAG